MLLLALNSRQCPRTPSHHPWWISGTVLRRRRDLKPMDKGLSQEAWELFKAPEHFGHRYQSSLRLQEPRRLIQHGQLLGGHLPWQTSSGHHAHVLGAVMSQELAQGAAHFANEARRVKIERKRT